MLYTYWLPFILTAVVLNITPGPDMIYLITQSISSGKRVGFASILGFGTGALIHSLFVALGVSAIISTSIVVFQIIKTIGAGYLIYMGVRSLLQRDTSLSCIGKNPKSDSFIRSYRNALIVDLTNPKVAIFFMALLPQFYRENGSSKVQQFITLGLIIVLIAFLIEGAIVILSDKISILFKHHPIISKIMEKAFGSLLILLGIKLLMEKESR